MKKKIKVLLFGLFAVQLNVALFAAVGGSFGTEVFTDTEGEQYTVNKVVLQPEFSIGEIDIGLDLHVYFDKEGNFINDNWDSSSDIINKILYLKYGDKGDPFYVKFGGLSNVIIGHGIIFNRYSNMVRYPEVIKRGLILDVDFDKVGFETLATNLARSEVYGGRFYFKPFHGTDVFLISNLTVGISGGVDVDPDTNDTTKNDQVSVGALDAELPLFNFSLFSATLFADVAQMELDDEYVVETTTRTNPSKNNGIGTATGVLGKFLIFDYQVQYKDLDDNFIYGYFDNYYEIERSTKANTISSTDKPKKRGWHGIVSYDFMRKINFLVSYEDLDNDELEIYPWVHAEVHLDRSLFMDKFFVSGSYDKKNASNWEEIQDFKKGNAIARLELGYAINPSTTLVVIKEYTYDINGDKIKKVKFETRFVF